MIQARQLTKWYGPTLALDAIDLDVDRGRIVGFLGPNGAGKSTAIRIITGYMPPTRGSASVDGQDVVTDSHAVRSRIGYMPENTPLYPEMRVDEHLHYFGKLHGLPRKARTARIDALADRCGLTAIRRRPVGQLSKGNRQRVGLAQAMLHDPPVLILDEPTAGLDPAQITAVRQLIRDMAGTKTVLLSTHILPEVEKTCQDVVIINRGRIVARGTPDQLRAKVRSGGRVIVEVQAGEQDVRKALEALAAVGTVQTESAGGWCTARIAPKDTEADIRPALGKCIVERGWVPRSMRYEVGSLEEYFIQITATANIEAA